MDAVSPHPAPRDRFGIVVAAVAKSVGTPPIVIASSSMALCAMDELAMKDGAAALGL